jgi:hypothetical protein
VPDKGGEISLVSLVFPRAGVADVVSVQAVEESTQRKLGCKAVESGDSLVVTLQLNLDQQSDPLLTVNTAEGNKSFRAIITPRHLLESYFELSFDGPSLALRDHGREDVLLKDGEKVILSPQDRVTLWNGSEVVLATRARLVNNGVSGRFLLRSNPEECRGWMNGQAIEGEIPVATYEQLGILVASDNYNSPVELTLERR